MTRSLAARVALAAVVALAGCGVPTERPPEVLSERELGVALPVGPSPVGREARPGTTPAVVFFLHADRLVPSVRFLPEPSLEASLRALLAGPNEQELDAGLRSALSPGTRLRGVAVHEGTATVDFGREVVSAGGAEAVLAAAQLVYTATETPGVNAVKVTVDGEPVQVPRADGTVTDAPVVRGDYAGLAPG